MNRHKLKYKKFNLKVKRAKVNVGMIVGWYSFELIHPLNHQTGQKLKQTLITTFPSNPIRVICPSCHHKTVSVKIPHTNFHVLPLKAFLRLALATKPGTNIYLLLSQKLNGELLKVNFPDLWHILVTGDHKVGKTIMVNAILIYFFTWYQTQQVKLIIIDQTNSSLNNYQAFSDLLRPVVKGFAAFQEIETFINFEINKRSWLITRSQVSIHKNTKDADQSVTIFPIMIIFNSLDYMVTTMQTKILKKITELSAWNNIHSLLSIQTPAGLLPSSLLEQFPVRVVLKAATPAITLTVNNQIGTHHLVKGGDVLIKVRPQASTRYQGSWGHQTDLEQVMVALNNQIEFRKWLQTERSWFKGK